METVSLEDRQRDWVQDCDGQAVLAHVSAQAMTALDQLKAEVERCVEHRELQHRAALEVAKWSTTQLEAAFGHA